MMYNFLYTADSNYFNHMYLSIYSLLKNNTYPLTIHIVESDFTKEQMEKLDALFMAHENADLKIYSVKEIKDVMDQYSIPKWRGTDIANARLFSGEIIDVDKILYIDCDTIISSSLKDVFHTNLNTPVSAVKEMSVPEHVKNRLSSYYNSGVLLIDYRLCAEIDFLRLLFDAMDTSIPLVYPDQDVLNLALSDRIGTLTPNYNISPLVYNLITNHTSLASKYLKGKEESFYNCNDLINAYKDPKIYHLLEYVGIRPWVKNRVHTFNSIYDKYCMEALGSVDKEKPSNKVDLIITSISIIPTISILLEVMPFKEQLDIKNKIRKILYPNGK